MATYQCVATIRLRNGQITVQGLNEFQGQGDPGPFRFAITGGTGAYSGASGEVVVRYDRARKGYYTLRFDARNKHRH